LSPDFDPLDPPPEGYASAPSGFGGMLHRAPQAAIRLRISVTGVGRDALAGLSVSDLGGQLSGRPKPSASPFGSSSLAAFPSPKEWRVSRAGLRPGMFTDRGIGNLHPSGCPASTAPGDHCLRSGSLRSSGPIAPPNSPAVSLRHLPGSFGISS